MKALFVFTEPTTWSFGFDIGSKFKVIVGKVNTGNLTSDPVSFGAVLDEVNEKVNCRSLEAMNLVISTRDKGEIIVELVKNEVE
ncbi:MAG: hypothetical protein HQK53_17170 [Oligoflexia bacterium]|nr:hypothetical protein [Oligoflexia bacterium]